MKKIVLLLIFILGVFLIGTQTEIKSIYAQESTVCCERTVSGAFCQNVPAEECAADAQQVPTSCELTSFCKAGTCFDSNEGICLDNTPQLVCNNNGGIWSEESPPQCELGCCILGDQAAFVSLVRCKRLSGFLGLQTNYKKGITNELACIAEVQAQDKGACVFEFEFENFCEFTTRTECDARPGDFYKDKLCSAEELGTVCGPTTLTTTIPGKDEVYFRDTCGNAANIYDAGKINDVDYWTNVKTKDESCNAGNANILNPNCGNCNYLLGSFARDRKAAGKNPTYGDYICADLTCLDDEGNKRRHGESWCVYDDEGGFGKGDNAVGSRFHKQICINGEVVLEACADFRAEECIEDSIPTAAGPFSQAACRVNRWQDCLIQDEKRDCENSDRRDCFWQEGVTLRNESIEGVCLPKNSPGLNFWNSEETNQICSQANAACVVTFEKGLFGGAECVENCECLEEEWLKSHLNVCSAVGDCGVQINWVGRRGFKEGFNISIERLRRQE